MELAGLSLLIVGLSVQAFAFLSARQRGLTQQLKLVALGGITFYLGCGNLFMVALLR